MHRICLVIALACLSLGLAGCSGDRIEDTEGGVVLSVSDFDGLATRVSVNNAGNTYTLGQIQISNLPKSNRTTSDLMNVEMDTYEVVYERIGGGTRTPTTLVRRIFGVAPISGTIEYDNLPLMGVEQFDNQPLEDLLFENGAFDQETGEQVITLNLNVRFFGRTLAGEDVATEPIAFTVEFVP
ncbi:MAG: hypothetical protein AAGD01_07325 [Acidobacteriota bacterium]